MVREPYPFPASPWLQGGRRRTGGRLRAEEGRNWGIPRRRRGAMLGRSSPHPLQNSPQVLSIFAPICAFTRKFRRGSSRLRGVQLTCNPEPSPRLKREKSGASLGPTLYLVSGSSPRGQRLPILRATSPHWAGPAGSGRGLPRGAHAPRPSLLPRLGVPGPGSKRGSPCTLHRRGLRLPGFGLWS